MKRSFLMTITLAFALILAGTAWAGYHKDGHGGFHQGKGGGPMDGIMRYLKQLDLTDAQKNEIQAITEQHAEKLKALHGDMKSAREALRSATLSETYDEQAIRSASRTLSAHMEEMAVLKGEIASAVRQVLTPEQIAELGEIRQQHKEKKGCFSQCRKSARE